MNDVLLYTLLYVFSVFISAVSQILLKKSAQKDHASLIKEYLNPYVIIAYSIFFSAAFLSTICLRYVDMAMGAVLESLGYFFVLILSRIFLAERMTKKQTIGMVIVILGTILFQFG